MTPAERDALELLNGAFYEDFDMAEAGCCVGLEDLRDRIFVAEILDEARESRAEILSSTGGHETERSEERGRLIRALLASVAP